MERNDILAALQHGIIQLTNAVAEIALSGALPADAQNELTVTVETEEGKHEVVIFADGAILFAPGMKGIDVISLKPPHFPDRMSLRGKPIGIGDRTCPRCSGRGKV